MQTGRWRRPAPRASAGLIVCGIAAIVLVAAWAGPWGEGAAAPEPSASPSPSGPTTSAAPIHEARAATTAVSAEAPVSTRLPNGVVVEVRAVSARADGQLAVPHDIRTAGWWRGGSRLGDPFGSTLIAAHVDSRTQGLGPYASLLSARPGQRVTVRSRHLVQTFAIRSLSLVPQGPLTHHGGLFAVNGPRRLTLVTCAGPYVRTRGGYQNLAVLVADPLSPPRQVAR